MADCHAGMALSLHVPGDQGKGAIPWPWGYAAIGMGAAGALFYYKKRQRDQLETQPHGEVLGAVFLQGMLLSMEEARYHDLQPPRYIGHKAYVTPAHR